MSAETQEILLRDKGSIHPGVKRISGRGLRPPRYVIHVGLPKTGTKYLQRAFWLLRDQLRADGVYYPTEWWLSWPGFSHHELGQELNTVPNPRVRDIFAHLNRSGSEVVLLSCEGFIELADWGLQYLRDLTEGAEVNIVIFVRRWSDWLPSQWKQVIKQGMTQTFDQWYSRGLLYAGQHPGINQATFIEKFERIFGRTALRLLSYSNLQDQNVDILQSFFDHVLRRPVPAGIPTGEIVHPSLDTFVTELIRCLNLLQSHIQGKSDHTTFEQYRSMMLDEDILKSSNIVFTAMRTAIGEGIVDDNSLAFSEVFSRLNSYRDAMPEAHRSDMIFERKKRVFDYILPDYLLQPGIVPLIHAIYAKLQTHNKR